MVLPLTFSLLFLSLQTLAAFNVSHLNLFHSTVESPPSPSPFLKDVLKAISVKQRWRLEEVRVSEVDVRNVRVGNCQRYEFRVRFGKTDLVYRFSDEISLWKKLRKKGEFGLDLIGGTSSAVLKPIELEGPFELRAYGDHEFSLQLPQNTTHTGLRRVLVREGITVQIKDAEEVILFHPYNSVIPSNRSSAVKQSSSQFWPSSYSSCMPLPTIDISSSASLVAYRISNPETYIATSFLSQDSVELLPDKCYSDHFHRKLECPIHFLASRLALLEKLLRSILGDRILQNQVSGFSKAKIMTSNLVRFQLELKRDVRLNDTQQETLASWRTKPSVERVWFEIVARVEGEKLKPLMLKKIRPFISADTAAWSNLMSNVSFTKFPSVVVPPEALTLDVKW